MLKSSSTDHLQTHYDDKIVSHLLGLGKRVEKSGLRMKYSSATLLTVVIFFSRRGRASA